MDHSTAIDGVIPISDGGGGLPMGYVHGAVPSNNAGSPGDAVDISAGVVRDDSNSETIELSAPATIDFTVNGAGGLDVGALAASSWYSVWAIKDPSGTGTVDVLGSLSELAPTLPAGFTFKRRVGWVRTDAGAAFFPFLYIGQGFLRVHSYAYRDFNDTDMLNGASTGAYIAVDCTGFIPPGQRAILVRMGSSAAAGLFEAKPGDGAQAAGAAPYRTDSFASGQGSFPFPAVTSAARGLQIRLANVAAFFSISALGFYDVI